jgi:hypothetical protein
MVRPVVWTVKLSVSGPATLFFAVGTELVCVGYFLKARCN